jgi:exonuclease III
VVSEKLVSKMADSIIRDEAYGASDHVPSVLILKDMEL